MPVQVDFSCNDPKELETHFAACGTILRVTIMFDKWTGQPKGYVNVRMAHVRLTFVIAALLSARPFPTPANLFRFAYVEFMDKSSVPNAVELNESIFKGRPLKVLLSFLL